MTPSTRRLWTLWSTAALLLVFPMAWVVAGNNTYLSSIMVEGKPLRFDNKPPTVNYFIDALEESPNWDYRTRDFLKDQVVKDAFQDWQVALNHQLMFREVRDPRQARIKVHWRNGFHERFILGLERPQIYASGQHLARADIEITLTDAGKKLSQNTLKAIALHEIGHGLGMHGHSPYRGDIMYASIQDGVYRLSARDVETIRALYNHPL